VTDRRFPPPWSVEEQEACFVMRTMTVKRWRMSISGTFLKPLPRDLLPNAPLRDGSLVDQVFAGMSAKPVVYHVMRF
jgi:hypothetical protein